MLPSRLTWENFGGDSGDFLAALLTGGVPHPSGYPTYLLLGELFQALPLGTPYFRGALLSAFSTALACGLLSLWVSALVGRRDGSGPLAGVVAGLAAGTAPLIWSQAVIVEVHGLQALFVVFGLWWLSSLLLGPWSGRQRRSLFGLAFLAGLGLGNHLTLLLFAPVWGLALWRAYRRGLSRGAVFGQIGMVFCGSLVYLALPLRAQNLPAVNWGNPQTAEGFWWLVSAQPYRDLLFATPLALYPQRALAWFGSLREQFGLLGLAFGLAGIAGHPFGERELRWSLVWLVAAFSIYSLGYYSRDSQVYLAPVYLVFAAWIGLGAAQLRGVGWRGVAVGVLLLWAPMGLILWRVPTTYVQVDARRNYQAAEFAQDYLENAPQGAVLLSESDYDTFALWYYHFGLGWRPDVVIVVPALVPFDWYRQTLNHAYPGVALPDTSDFAGDPTSWVDRFLRSNPGRPLCRSRVDPEPSHPAFTECSEP